jgi:hypothetical protein
MADSAEDAEKARLALQKQKLEKMKAMDEQMKKLAVTSTELKARFDKETERLKGPSVAVMNGWRDVMRLMTVSDSTAIVEERRGSPLSFVRRLVCTFAGGATQRAAGIGLPNVSTRPGAEKCCNRRYAKGLGRR